MIQIRKIYDGEQKFLDAAGVGPNVWNDLQMEGLTFWALSAPHPCHFLILIDINDQRNGTKDVTQNLDKQWVKGKCVAIFYIWE